MLSELSFKKLFLIDGIGATTTTLLLILVLARFEPIFGMPRHVLNILAGIAGCFDLYSLLCYKLLQKKWIHYLRGIAVTNTVYCIVTAILVIKFYESLTWLGVAYFIGEIIIILGLVRLELKLATQASRDHSKSE